MVVKWTAPLSSPWTSLVIGAISYALSRRMLWFRLATWDFPGAQFLLAEQAPYILLMRKTDCSGGRGKPRDSNVSLRNK